MFSKILFPTDGSEASDKVFECVLDMAKKYDAKVTLVNVYDVLKGEKEEDKKEESTKSLKKYKKLLKESDVKVKAVALKKIKKSPGYSIIYVKEKEKCNLIIMGCRSIGKFQKMLLGSVSNYVLKNSDIPVMIIE